MIYDELKVVDFSTTTNLDHTAPFAYEYCGTRWDFSLGWPELYIRLLKLFYAMGYGSRLRVFLNRKINENGNNSVDFADILNKKRMSRPKEVVSGFFAEIDLTPTQIVSKLVSLLKFLEIPQEKLTIAFRYIGAPSSDAAVREKIQKMAPHKEAQVSTKIVEESFSLDEFSGSLPRKSTPVALKFRDLDPYYVSNWRSLYTAFVGFIYTYEREVLLACVGTNFSGKRRWDLADEKHSWRLVNPMRVPGTNLYLEVTYPPADMVEKMIALCHFCSLPLKKVSIIFRHLSDGSSVVVSEETEDPQAEEPVQTEPEVATEIEEVVEDNDTEELVASSESTGLALLDLENPPADLDEATPARYELMGEFSDECETWRLLYSSIVEQLAEKNPLLKRDYVNKNLVGGDGLDLADATKKSSLRDPMRVAANFWLECNRSAPVIASKLRKLLEVCHLDESQLRIWYASETVETSEEEESTEETSEDTNDSVWGLHTLRPDRNGNYLLDFETPPRNLYLFTPLSLEFQGERVAPGGDWNSLYLQIVTLTLRNHSQELFRYINKSFTEGGTMDLADKDHLSNLHSPVMLRPNVFLEQRRTPYAMAKKIHRVLMICGIDPAEVLVKFSPCKKRETEIVVDIAHPTPDINQTTPVSLDFGDESLPNLISWDRLYLSAVGLLVDDFPDILRGFVNMSFTGSGKIDLADELQCARLSSPKRLDTNSSAQLWLECARSPYLIVQKLAALLTHCGVDKGELVIRCKIPIHSSEAYIPEPVVFKETMLGEEEDTQEEDISEELATSTRSRRAEEDVEYVEQVVNLSQPDNITHNRPSLLVYKGKDVEVVPRWSWLYVQFVNLLFADYNEIMRTYINRNFSERGARIDLGDENQYARMQQPKLLNNGLYLETCLSAKNTIQRIYLLMDICGLSEEDVVVKCQVAREDLEQYQDDVEQPEDELPEEEDDADVPPYELGTERRLDFDTFEASDLQGTIPVSMELFGERFDGFSDWQELYRVFFESFLDHLPNFVMRLINTSFLGEPGTVDFADVSNKDRLQNPYQLDNDKELYLSEPDRSPADYVTLIKKLNELCYSDVRRVVIKYARGKEQEETDQIVAHEEEEAVYRGSSRSIDETVFSTSLTQTTPHEKSPIGGGTSTDNQLVKSYNASKPSPALSTEEEKIAQILASYFGDNGFPLGKMISQMRFKSAYEEAYGVGSLRFEGERLDKIIKKIGIIRDDRVFPRGEENELGKVLEEVYQTLDNGASAIVSDALYERCNKVCNKCRIYSSETLCEELQKLDANDRRCLKFTKSHILPKSGSIKFQEDLIRILKGSFEPVSTETIQEKAWFVGNNLTRLREKLSRIESLVRVDQGKYFYAKNLPISSLELNRITTRLLSALAQHHYLFTSDLFAILKEEWSDFKSFKQTASDDGVRNIFGYLLKDSLSIKPGVISQLGQELNKAEVYAEFARDYERFTWDDLMELVDNLVIDRSCWRALLSTTYRISPSEFVSPSLLPIDDTSVEIALDEQLHRDGLPVDFCPIKDINYIKFPATAQWNEFLLESYLLQHRDRGQFILINSSFSQDAVYGAVVRKNSKTITDYESLCVEALLQSGLLKDGMQGADVADFIVNSGLQRNRTMQAANSILQKAMQRQRKG